VVDLGVDRDRFHPSDVTQARRKLGIALEEYVLTYVGVLDLTHNLEPVIRALALSRRPDLVLEVVGDGERRSEYQQLARDLGAPVRFRGKVPHAAVPDHIAAADLCLAPYDAAAFASGELGYSTMKIPEYLSCGRAVVTVPSGRTRSMIEHGVSGFLLANQTQRWQEFLMDLPTRERVREMGVAAARVALSSWDDTARAYHDLLVQLLARRGQVGG
jgi:glycosyltransferase involved in cell wall biosynthesis